MSRTSLSGALIALGGLALTAFNPLVAQETKLDRDIEFVRNLATKLRFIALAQSEVERLQRDYKGKDDFKKVSQLGVEISLIGARSDPDRERRRTLFKDALDRSKDFIERYADDDVATRARRTLVEACYEYGAFLIEEVDLAREEAPDQVAELETRAIEVYRTGIEAAEKVMATLDRFLSESGSPQQTELFITWMFKGMLRREMARADRENRTPLCSLARDDFENLIFEAGEETLLGQRAWFEMAKINEVRNDYAAAVNDFDLTIKTIKTSLSKAAEYGIPQQAQELMFDLLQEAYAAGTAVRFRSGDVAATLEMVGKFREDLKTFGQEGLDPFEIASPTYGHPVFLTEARALSETGDAEKVAAALAQVQKINDAHPADIIGLRAKAVLKDILKLQASMVSGPLLFEVAKGDYQSQDYERALQGMKRAYATMTESERRTLGLEAFGIMARCYGLQQRPLEATLAAMEGLERHGRDGGQGSPETVAATMDQAWQLFRRDSKSDDAEPLPKIGERLLGLLREFGGGDTEAELLWKQGFRYFNEKQYLKAAESFASMPADSAYYEPSRGAIVQALQTAGETDRARQAIAEYRAWLETPAASLQDAPADARQRRAETVATMAFFDAYIDYQAATGERGGTTDPTQYRPTINKIQTFLSQHREAGKAYVERAYDMLGRLHAQLGEVGKAEEVYRTLRAQSPNSQFVALLATQIFKSHYDTVKQLETELQALESNGAAAADQQRVGERLDQARRAAIDMGLDYMQSSTSPAYGVLANTASLAADLKDWTKVETVSRKILDVHGGAAENVEKIDSFVKPLLGEALMRQRNFKEAVPFLRTAVEARPNNGDLKRLLSLAEGGWWEFDSVGRPVEIAGLDEPASAYDRHWNDYKVFVLAKHEEFSLPWYEFQWECFAFAKRAANKGDSKYADLAQKHFNIAKSIDNFETLKSKRGKRGTELYQLFSAVNR